MEQSRSSWLTYGQALDLQRTHPVRLTEVPVEYALSLPVPTRRWHEASYAQFAAPMLRRPEEASVCAAPDRWWVIDAAYGHLMVYARMTVLPFAAELTYQASPLPPVTRPLAELRRLNAELAGAIDAVAIDFFADQPGDAGAWRRAAELLHAAIPAPLVPVYRALAPDFFSRLDAGSAPTEASS